MNETSSRMTASTRPVCFSGRPHSAETGLYLPPSFNNPHVQWDVSDQCIEAFACLVPLLACGEESAIHVFSCAAAREPTFRRNGHSIQSLTAQALSDIAADEMRHEAWLAAWRAKLPDNLDKSIRRQARRFFSGLGNDNPALHFIRIAALDSAVCQILAPLITNGAPLSNVSEINLTLNRIRTDEARHVRISRACATNWGATPEQIRAEWLSVRNQLVTLLESVGPDLAILGADPDKLFSRLRRAPEFPASGAK